MANAEKLHATAGAAYQLLYEGEEGRSVLEALGEAEMQLAGLTRFDPALTPLVTMLQGVTEQIADAATNWPIIRSARNSIRTDWTK